MNDFSLEAMKELIALARKDALQEALDAMPKTMPKHYAPWKSREGVFVDALCSCHDAIDALLAADPREASEPLQSTDRANAPADHGPGADANGETGTKTYEDGIRDALAALEAGCMWHDPEDLDLAYKRISALLSQPKDEAEEIVEAWKTSPAANEGPQTDTDTWGDVTGFARWLISQGWRAPNDR